MPIPVSGRTVDVEFEVMDYKFEGANHSKYREKPPEVSKLIVWGRWLGPDLPKVPDPDVEVPMIPDPDVEVPMIPDPSVDPPMVARDPAVPTGSQIVDPEFDWPEIVQPGWEHPEIAQPGWEHPLVTPYNVLGHEIFEIDDPETLLPLIFDRVEGEARAENRRLVHTALEGTASGIFPGLVIENPINKEEEPVQ